MTKVKESSYIIKNGVKFPKPPQGTKCCKCFSEDLGNMEYIKTNSKSDLYICEKCAARMLGR